MKTIGMLATGTFVIVAGFGLLLFIRSIPEIRRYMKISSM
jgi:uncharacterized protein DUF6893